MEAQRLWLECAHDTLYDEFGRPQANSAGQMGLRQKRLRSHMDLARAQYERALMSLQAHCKELDGENGHVWQAWLADTTKILEPMRQRAAGHQALKNSMAASIAAGSLAGKKWDDDAVR